MRNIKAFYLEKYKDQFFIDTPPFFEFFMWTEVFFQGPVMLWSIGGLLRGEIHFNPTAQTERTISVFLPTPHARLLPSPNYLDEFLLIHCTDSSKVPLVLLPYAVLIFVTTGACMYEFWFWDVPLDQKLSLTTLYGPYLAICKYSL